MLVPGHEDDVEAVVSQAAGEGQAEARRAARHHWNARTDKVIREASSRKGYNAQYAEH